MVEYRFSQEAVIRGRRRAVTRAVINAARRIEPEARAVRPPARFGARPMTAAGDAAHRSHDALIEAIAARRDREAFLALYGFYAPRVKAYLIRSGGSHLADETTQEAMLAVWRKAALFDPAKASASTWIFTIARNLFIDRKRRERRPEIDPSDPLLAVEGVAPADSILSARQNEQRVRAALSSLPAEQAKVVTMAFFEDKPHSAIAEELKLPLGTVKSRLRLAFGRLRGALGEMP
jgi:RNA polymerase sigma-70 factor (ECF subfamily)